MGTTSTVGTTVTLNLNTYDSNTNAGGYVDYDAATDTYTWKAQNVSYGKKWTLTENNYTGTHTELDCTSGFLGDHHQRPGFLPGQHHRKRSENAGGLHFPGRNSSA